MLRVYPDQVPILHRLLQNKDMLRISGYVNREGSTLTSSGRHKASAKSADAFKEFAPKLYDFYRVRMDELMESDEGLRPPYLDSVFACTAFNFGPQVVSTPHRDHLNLAYGWCSITAFGDFDHKAGGHLVLPDLKLAIEFPAGSTILIPSALFTHYNVPIGLQETRRSITQFSAGGIFRWINYGFQLKRVATATSVKGQKWWDKGEGLYTIWPTDDTEAEAEELGCRRNTESG